MLNYEICFEYSSCSTCFERLTRSSSGVLPNILYYTVQSVQSCYQASIAAIAAILFITVYYAVLLMMNDLISSKYVKQAKNCRIKIDCKNCASRCLLTHCNMMHGTYNVKLGPIFGQMYLVQTLIPYYQSPV